MNPLDQLNGYVGRLESRLRWAAVSRGAALAAGTALLITVTLILITNAFAFSETSLFWARVALFLAVAAAVGFGLLWPLMTLNRRRAARRAESLYPEFQERLLTYVESGPNRDPFVELLASDAAGIAERSEPAKLAPAGRLLAFAGSAAFAAAVLVWLILAGPGYFGYGAARLWAGTPRIGAADFYQVLVEPGDKVVRRSSDLTVTARLVGFEAPRVRLLAKYRGSSKWEEANMAPQPSAAAAYEFVFPALPESVEYYVDAGGVQSKHFNVTVVDLPRVKRMKVRYDFPSWLGMASVTEDPGGDLRAVAGTVAELTIEFDRPLALGSVVLDDGKKIELAGNGTRMVARVPVEKDGMYHLAAVEQGQSVRLTEDYFIEARQDREPILKIARPGRDAKVSPIEEVVVEVEAEDDFALRDVTLYYSVNGTAEKAVKLGGGGKTAQGRTMLALEEFQLVPGDVVSLYATAKDARNTARTDMYFLEAQPFEREYSQAQQQGGGGGGDMDSAQISGRQKEIIVATSNELRSKDSRSSAENAKFLADMQAKLRDQAKTLAERAKARQLSGTNQQFQTFVKEMEESAKAMDVAVPKLQSRAWKEALGPEQQALQHMLRAEAVFREIQLAFGQQQGN